MAAISGVEAATWPHLLEHWWQWVRNIIQCSIYGYQSDDVQILVVLIITSLLAGSLYIIVGLVRRVLRYQAKRVRKQKFCL